MLPDSYEEISKEQGRSVIKIDSRVLEFIHESGAAFTLYEKSGNGYVGCLMAPGRNSKYYEVHPSKVVNEEIEWPSSDCQFIEPATFPLLNAGWQLTYYDAEHGKEQIFEFFNED